jgi:hypothetical protein
MKRNGSVSCYKGGLGKAQAEMRKSPSGWGGRHCAVLSTLEEAVSAERTHRHSGASQRIWLERTYVRGIYRAFMQGRAAIQEQTRQQDPESDCRHESHPGVTTRLSIYRALLRSATTNTIRATATPKAPPAAFANASAMWPWRSRVIN